MGSSRSGAPCANTPEITPGVEDDRRDTPHHLSAALADLVAKAAPSVVSVRSYRSQSTGFVWRPGLIVTPDEALSEDGEITVAVPGGDSVSAQLVGRDPATDVAVLRIDRPDLQALQLTATTPAVGALTMAVGSIDGTPVASFGVVSHAGGPWRSLRGGNIDARIELDLRLRRNAEGGIALDTSGAAYGMAVFGPRRRVLVIPAATIERVADKLASHGRIPRAYLGQNLPVRRPKWIPRFGPEPEVPSDVTYLAGVILLCSSDHPLVL